MNDALAKTSKGHKIGASGAGLAAICFFLPWMLVNCSGQQKDLNGWQLASGTTVGSGLYTQQISGRPILFLVLLAALGVLALVYLAWKRGHLTKLDSYGLIALGALPLLILLIQFSGAKDQASQQGIYIEYKYGLWGVVIGFLIVIVGGVLNLREKP